jgi:hypothetical protein
MNWIKGLDRIYIVFSIFIFASSTIIIFPETVYMPWWANPNPQYETWYKEHGKKYEEFNKKRFGSINGRRFRFELADEYPVPPPSRYLRIELYKRIISSVVPSIFLSLIILFGMASLTRLVNITFKWIIKGFKSDQ